MNKTWILSAAVLLSGCAQMDTLPEAYARNQWIGLPADTAVQFYGRPQQLSQSADRSTVAMRWLYDTSVTREEVVARTSEVQGNVRVNTNHFANVTYTKGCAVTVTVNRQMKIVGFDMESGSLMSQGCDRVAKGPP
ncbi:hypothetical protein VDS41_18075 [Xanthomonas campestris pv. campestris]|nr:hypothetical protein [Xanthomonas campestris pv. campestris]